MKQDLLRAPARYHRVHECPTTSPPGHRGNGKSVWLALVRRARKQKGDEQVYHIKHAGTLRKMNVSNFSALGTAEKPAVYLLLVSVSRQILLICEVH